MAEYSANENQTILPGETAIFPVTVVPCNRGLVRHRAESGNFLLSGWVPRRGCCCRQKSAPYLIKFGANIAVPEGGSAEAISVALTLDGSTIPASTMTVTPNAVEQFFNVSRAINVEVWNGCCETVAVKNTSTQAITMSSGNIIIDRPDLAVSC